MEHALWYNDSMSAMRKFRDKFIGDRQFYAGVLALAVPMILQNLITSFVSMLDNIMVGQIGTAQMSGVSIVNQFVFIYNITIFGAISGPSIFGAQFFGKGDYEGQRSTFRFRVLLSVIITAIFMVVYKVFDAPLISLYIAQNDNPELVTQTLAYGREYMGIIIFSLLPFGLGQAYSSLVRECEETRIPMYGSLAAIGVNLVLDYGLIFGKLGMPKMGVAGAAIATVIAKFIEAGVVIIWAHAHPEKNRYIIEAYRSLHIPADLLKDMIKKGYPLLFNEFLWVVGMSAIAQCYSIRGLDVVAARNISSTVVNLFNVFFVQVGGCTAILVGAKLGAGRHEEAIDLDNKLIFMSVFGSAILGLLMLPTAVVFPMIYNTEQEIKELSAYMIAVQALAAPIWAYTNSAYFTLRSGGRTGITFLFDFVFSWVIMIPLAFILAYLTDWDIHIVFAVVTYSELIKVGVGYKMVKSQMWVRTIVG